MSPESARTPLWRRLSKWLLVASGSLVILLAVALGLFRLLIGQIPEYQGEIKQWVAAELGVDVDFAGLDARLALTGPVLTLRETSLGGAGRSGFLQAERATIALDPMALILGRRIEISRLILDGVDLTFERDQSGRIHFGELAFDPDGPGLANVAEWIPQSVEVLIRNSALHYVDLVGQRRWDFADLELSIQSDADRLNARASLRPPEELATSLVFDVAGRPNATAADGRRWQASVDVRDLDLGSVRELMPFAVGPDLAGRGSVGAVTEWQDGLLQSAVLDLDLTGLEVGQADTPAFDSLALEGRWDRRDADSWRLALRDIALQRGASVWPGATSVEFGIDGDSEGFQRVELGADFLRLEDLEPFVLAFPGSQLEEQWRLFEPRGDITDLGFSLDLSGEDFSYALDAGFDRVAVERVGRTPGIAGASGHVRAREDGGRIEFASGALKLDWPALFPHVIDAESLTGAVVWRQGRDEVQIVSDGVGVGVLGQEARASFGIQIPLNGDSPTVDLRADLAIVDLVPAKNYLPEPIMPAAVVDWLHQAVQGGQAHNIELSFYGPASSFPFDDGKGQFRVAADIEDATLNYMTDWPEGEELVGNIEFLNAGFSAHGAGRVLGNRAEAVDIAIPDMRDGLLELSTTTEGPLASVVEYLRSAPLIAEHLGSDFDRVDVLGGTGKISTELDLPLARPADYLLNASLRVADGTLAIAGLGPEISEINGAIDIDDNVVSATDVDAVFLGGMVTVALQPSDRDGYRAELSVDGETTADAVIESFGLPHADFLAGQTLWSGQLLLPALDPLATTATRVTVESNLAGVALRFPEPLAKAPGEATNFRLDLTFEPGGGLDVSGNLGAARRFVLSFASMDGTLQLARGAVRFGGDEPHLPIQPGILVDGQLEALALDGWLDLAGESDIGGDGIPFLGADVDVGSFRAFGQQLGTTSLRVLRGIDAWQIAVDSEAIAGDIVVPYGSGSREPITADMQRFYLAAGQGGEIASVDPRTLPGIRLEAEEFGIGVRQLGRVSALVEPRARGLELTRFSSATEHYETELSGSWFQGPLGARTTIDARIRSSDVEAALGELGLDTVVSGESAEVNAEVYWDGAPGADWLDHLNGKVSIFVETGTLREVNPGAGRVVGLMSVAALPRRLALDFRDVFEDGFAFDEIAGDFRVIDGNAYTNNLILGGPAAEIGVVGRTGLRDRDYTQQIGVSTEPSKMLPTVAGLLAGPGAGAAMFVFTRLFKRPLKGLGHLSYCLEGSWEAPTVEPIDNDEGELAQRCADLPPSMLEETTDE